MSNREFDLVDPEYAFIRSVRPALVAAADRHGYQLAWPASSFGTRADDLALVAQLTPRRLAETVTRLKDNVERVSRAAGVHDSDALFKTLVEAQNEGARLAVTFDRLRDLGEKLTAAQEKLDTWQRGEGATAVYESIAFTLLHTYPSEARRSSVPGMWQHTATMSPSAVLAAGTSNVDDYVSGVLHSIEPGADMPRSARKYAAEVAAPALERAAEQVARLVAEVDERGTQVAGRLTALRSLEILNEQLQRAQDTYDDISGQWRTALWDHQLGGHDGLLLVVNPLGMDNAAFETYVQEIFDAATVGADTPGHSVERGF